MRNENADRAEQLQFLRFLAFGLIFLWHADYWVPAWFPHGNGAVNAVSFFLYYERIGDGVFFFSERNFFFCTQHSSFYVEKNQKGISIIFPYNYFYRVLFENPVFDCNG